MLPVEPIFNMLFSKEPGPKICCCPTNSSKLDGLNLSASGAADFKLAWTVAVLPRFRGTSSVDGVKSTFLFFVEFKDPSQVLEVLGSDICFGFWLKIDARGFSPSSRNFEDVALCVCLPGLDGVP